MISRASLDVFVRDCYAHEIAERQFPRAALQELALHVSVHAGLLEDVHDHVGLDVVGGLVDALHGLIVSG